MFGATACDDEYYDDYYDDFAYYDDDALDADFITTNSSLDASDAASSGKSATIAIDGLKNEAGCCHATGGKVTVSMMGSEPTEFEFGPTCGAALRNGDAMTLDECL